MNFKFNPKLEGSGIIECIPQKGKCPNNCPDCFFQSGRSYLEPLEENLPHIPTKEMTRGKIVRFNDGNDSNNQRELVEKIAKRYKNYFFNTVIPYKLEEFSAPVVLTINPGKITDIDYYRLNSIPKNLMFVRFRTNMWNVHKLYKAVDYYTSRRVVLVVTFMAYYNELVREDYRKYYEWKKRTVNSYWCLTQETIAAIMDTYYGNPYVYSCGIKGQYFCKFCGNCLRTFFATKEKMRK
ncbi:MAG: hypothetical protein V1901_04235 [Patescibacteria group bacterium]